MRGGEQPVAGEHDMPLCGDANLMLLISLISINLLFLYVLEWQVVLYYTTHS
jgi:hypothetical protein